MFHVSPNLLSSSIWEEGDRLWANHSGMSSRQLAGIENKWEHNTHANTQGDSHITINSFKGWRNASWLGGFTSEC